MGRVCFAVFDIWCLAFGSSRFYGNVIVILQYNTKAMKVL